jgi:phosphoketolase
VANLDPNRLQRLHRYWQAANYLTIGQIYLQENPAARAAAAGAHQAAAARTLGNLAGPQLHLRASEPPDPQQEEW